MVNYRRLKAAEYERVVEEAIRNAYVLNHKISPCNESFIPDVTVSIISRTN